MTPEEHKLLAEIEQDERALASCWHDPPAPNVGRIKQRVRVALEEMWLPSQPEETTARPDLAARTKTAMHAELARLRQTVQPAGQARWARLRVRLFRVSGSLAAAAGLALAFVTWQSPAPEQQSTVLTTMTNAFTAYELNDEFHTELALLEEELDELELMDLGLTGAELPETLIDDVDESIEDLWLDTEASEDVLGATATPTAWNAGVRLG